MRSFTLSTDSIRELRAMREEFRREVRKAERRHWFRRDSGGGAGTVTRPAIVSTEITPADGTGNATIDGRVRFMTHDAAGNATIDPTEIECLNIFQARIPIDVTVKVAEFEKRWYLVAADCDPQGPELQEAQSTTSSAISDISYTPITPTQTISRPGIYDFRYGVTIDATIPNNATLGYQLQLWDATNSQELGNTGPIFQTRSASGVVSDNGAFYSDLDALTADVDVQLRATNVGDGTLDSSIGDFLQTFGPL